MKHLYLKTVLVSFTTLLMLSTSACVRSINPEDDITAPTFPPFEVQTWAIESEPEHVFEKVAVKGYQESKEELAEYIESLVNMTADAEKLEIRYPKQVECLYDFDKHLTPHIISNQEFYDEFCRFMEFYAPDHQVDQVCITYLIDGESEYQSLVENRDRILNGPNNILLLQYDNRRESDRFYGIFGSPIGNDMTHFCKGVGAKYLDPRLQSLEVYGYSVPEAVAILSPDSTDVYRLLDGEIRVCDAVKFFEDYLKSIPGIYPAKRISSTKVWKVIVFRLTEETYGYYYLTTAEIYDVPMDYTVNGLQMHSEEVDKQPDCEYQIGFGSMVRCEEVDAVYGVYNGYQTEKLSSYDEIISCKEAVRLISNQLSEEIIFDVQSVELVYSSLKYKGQADKPENGITPVRATWKVQMLNSLDGCLYVCYVNAKEGTNFRYYSYSMEHIKNIFGEEMPL